MNLSDIDECDKSISPTGKCGVNSVCSNYPGGFSCVCAPGFTGNPSTGCFDVDECASNRLTCGREAQCLNKLGSYECKCYNGAKFDPVSLTCQTSVSSCSNNNQCPGNSICQAGNCACLEPNVGPNCESKNKLAFAC